MAKTLVLGAGYAGIMAATRLDRNSEPFTLINKYQYHYFTTLLHEAAGGRGTPMDYTVSLDELLKEPSSELEIAEVTGIDRDKKTVHTTQGDFDYEWLIISLGWVPAYFGIEGLDQHSMVLTNVDSAIHIRRHIEEQFQTYMEDGDEERLRIAIGGAGLTGVELAGELLDWIPELCVKYGIDASKVDLQNIEAMPTILPQVSESLRENAAEVLREKGATLRTNTKIVKVEENEVHLEGGDVVHAKTIIWTGGVQANPLLREAGFTVDRRGRAKVDKYLRSVDDSHVFIGGDTAWFETEDGNSFPPTAQIATQMGKFIGDNLISAIHDKEMKPFHGSLKGTLASIGREVGVGNVAGLPVRGMVAGLAKEATKVKYLWELGGARLAAEKTGQIVSH
ncbi:NAD(P)/FAD-dependent oxidoreductase [Alicyclobacillus sp. SO9]|uniref:NAD(P)/FAD-dependent oxidoreductase n=1 Tax=Alicyclobacillus sp. SO9 TaxID=2665646 RepID=UPI0018E8EBED|nr:NAD(P)/FAD-dependent oxidoreductase [Alicyclobacillus sp. SO9]QQE77354.1 NAD(P)/FAD-dependent oxidoreductase [Alicyclobacillus sp. SO9]